jgi:hypothetical protein
LMHLKKQKMKMNFLFKELNKAEQDKQIVRSQFYLFYLLSDCKEFSMK